MRVSASVKARVERGVKLLDRRRVGWEADLVARARAKGFDILSPSMCVLGHIFVADLLTGYYRGRKLLGISDMAASKYGLNVGTDGETEAQQLTEAWQRVLIARHALEAGERLLAPDPVGADY